MYVDEWVGFWEYQALHGFGMMGMKLWTTDVNVVFYGWNGWIYTWFDVSRSIGLDIALGPSFAHIEGKFREGEWSYLLVSLGCFGLLLVARVCSGCLFGVNNYI